MDGEFIERADDIFLARPFLHGNEGGRRQLRRIGGGAAPGQRKGSRGTGGQKAGHRIRSHHRVLKGFGQSGRSGRKPVRTHYPRIR